MYLDSREQVDAEKKVKFPPTIDSLRSDREGRSSWIGTMSVRQMALSLADKKRIKS